MTAAPAPAPIPLRALVREIPGAALADAGSGDVLISGVHHDSRRVGPGDLFVARAGARARGSDFVQDAEARGARAVLCAPGEARPATGLPIVEAADVPRALAFAAAAVYGHPTFGLDVVGITGTNGKTTTAHLVRAAIDAAGGRTGIIGTLGYRFGDLDVEATHTSPEADELARLAAAMLARGATHLAMEVSSIAVAQKRVEAVHFRVAAFTNLTQDHLDFHGSMQAYADAKARLFLELGPALSVVNVDDPFGVELARRLGEGAQLSRYSADPGAASAEVHPLEKSHTAEGIRLVVRAPAGSAEVRSPLLGAHNVSNLLCAMAIVSALGLDLQAAAAALSRPISVPGRLERCDEADRDDVVVLVDYAHTPDALARVLVSVRGLSAGRVVCVFGCGGDRDPTKRPLMGEAVGRAADAAIVTNDNPRSEDPRAIADAILPGIARGTAEVSVELDRREAIRRAVLEAKSGDLVLIAGKGHEPYQIVGATTLPFDDRAEARAALKERAARKGRR
jgi:UDP-N-acetylmuramoyl-L-alanyl-D-glutamate--2,6-diaminopimelate ligase